MSAFCFPLKKVKQSYNDFSIAVLRKRLTKNFGETSKFWFAVSVIVFLIKTNNKKVLDIRCEKVLY